MTSEVLIMNKNGLSLAADSAVTIAGDSGTPKIYNSFNKLFSLNWKVPVGVMIYGSSELYGLPWEQIVKQYRYKYPDVEFPVLLDYVEHFKRYLDDDIAKTENTYSYFKECIKQEYQAFEHNIRSKLSELKQDSEKQYAKNAARIFSQCLDDSKSLSAEMEERFNINSSIIDSVRESFSSDVLEMFSEESSLIPDIPEIRDEVLRVIIVTTVSRPSQNPCGVVISGFGSTQILPRAYAFESSLFDGDKINFNETFSGAVEHNNTCTVKAFAQSNETHNFMRGISETIEEFIRDDVENEILSDFVDNFMSELDQSCSLEKKTRQSIKKSLHNSARDFHADMISTIEKISAFNFWGPVVNAVAYLSPSEMAKMAETFVNLESFRQQITFSSETVGGPIDVAVITKGDGFIWIKRKHYFEKELNPHFFSNFHGGDSDR